MTPQERDKLEWAQYLAAKNAADIRRAERYLYLALIAACAGIVAGYLICKLAG